MARYIYNRQGWPRFHWDAEALLTLLSSVRMKQGQLTGKMAGIGFPLLDSALLDTLSTDIIRSSLIEGEILVTQEVRSSLAKKLGVEIAGLVDSSRSVDGLVDMVMDATENWEAELTEDRLFGWHAAMFPEGRSGMLKIVAGNWREDTTRPMQVVSGAMGREVVHFEAPHFATLPEEMAQLFAWLNSSNKNEPLIDAAIAHLWFITIHPFEDGNGRIARALTDLMFCRSEKQSKRFFSMSATISDRKKEYYNILESTQKGGLDITEWILWFLSCLEGAIDEAELTANRTLAKHLFWNKHKAITFNIRQLKMIELLFGDFFGKLTTSKWAKINKCSPDTALRDIQDLVKKEILKKSDTGGRSTHYELEI